jgi:hypothetical protein
VRGFVRGGDSRDVGRGWVAGSCARQVLRETWVVLDKYGCVYYREAADLEAGEHGDLRGEALLFGVPRAAEMLHVKSQSRGRIRFQCSHSYASALGLRRQELSQ